MTVLSIREIYNAALSAGFTPHQAVTWTSIALAESGGNNKALNNHGEYSVGLWQVNVRNGVRANKWGDLTDPRINAKAAYEISRGGRDIRPWTTTHDVNKGTLHDFRHYIDKVEQVVGVEGDHRGVHGYYSQMLKPLHYDTSYDQIDEGRSLVDDTAAGGGDQGQPLTGTPAVVTDLDTDQDGLTDAFERLAGTSPMLADTDRDGLTDGYEAAVSHTDPLATDTDGDGISDADEVAAHTDAGRLPGIAGVVGTGRFAENARNGIVDADHDGLSDHTEKLVGTDPNLADTDHDNLSDAEEAAIGSNPFLADTDHDGLTDGIEVSYKSDPLSAGADSTGQVAPWTLDAAADLLAGQAQAQAQLAQQSSFRSSAGSGAMDGAAGGGTGESVRTSKLHTFLAAAKAQENDPYVYGAPRTPTAKDPTSFDCSSLTQWAARQAGVRLASTAEYQYMELKQQHRLISVDEALHTPGALLFYFSEEPTAGLPPGKAHVAISKGDGTTIEARNTAMGIGEWSAKHRFRWAAVLPGISDAEGQKEYREYLAATGHTGNGWHAPAQTETAVHSSANAFDIDSGTPLGHPGLVTAGTLGRPGLGNTGMLGQGAYGTPGLLTGPPGYGSPGLLTGPPAYGTSGLLTGQLPGANPGGFDIGGPDTDHDGLTDAFERLVGTSVTLADTDADDISDAEEIALGTNPLVADTDRDGLADGVELDHGSDPLAVSGLGAGAGQQGFGGALGTGGLPGALGAGHGSLLPAVGDAGSAADALDHG